LVVAFTEFRNIPYTKATHSRSSCHTSHLQGGTNTRNPPANKAKAATASKAAELMPKKHAQKGRSGKGAPKKGHSAKYCKWFNTADGPFTTHDTSECRRFLKDGSPKDKPTKPFDTAKNPWKKTGSGDSSQMTYLTEKVAKLEK
jgi:hypothetical protein